jgi:hypothetical protein
VKFCTHKRRRGHKPTARCRHCWLAYLEENRQKPVTCGDLLNFYEIFIKVDRFKIGEMWKTWGGFQR